MTLLIVETHAQVANIATPLLLTVALIMLVLLAIYGFLEPRRFPRMASLLAKFGLQPKADALIITIQDVALPPGDFVVQFKCGVHSFDARPSKDGEYHSSSWVDLERRIVDCEVKVLVDGEPAVSKPVKAVDLLQTAKRSPYTLIVRLPGGDGEPLGTVTLQVEFPSSEKTPLLDSLNQDSRRLKAAVAHPDVDADTQAEVLEKLLSGPITCLGNDAKWCRMENRPRADKAVWFWCFYSREVSAASDALWILPVASIVDFKATARDSFEVTARDQNKKETLFFRVPGEVGIWVEGLKALRDHARYDDNVAKRKTWLSMGSADRQATRTEHEAASKNV